MELLYPEAKDGKGSGRRAMRGEREVKGTAEMQPEKSDASSD